MPDKATAIFAQRLKDARAMRDVSQRALGAMLGMTKKNGSVRINRYEQLTSRADMDTAAEIAAALDVPLAYLFAEDANQAKLVLAYHNASADDREAFDRLVKRVLGAKTERQP